MAKLRISGIVYEAPSIEIKGGHLIVGDKDLGVIGFECCVVCLEGSKVKDEPGHIRWE